MTPNPVTPIYTDKNNLYLGHNHLLTNETLSYVNDKINTNFILLLTFTRFGCIIISVALIVPVAQLDRAFAF